MITISKNGDVVTLINVFTCQQENAARVDRRMDPRHRDDLGESSGHHLGGTAPRSAPCCSPLPFLYSFTG